MRNGKVNLLLEPDAVRDPPDVGVREEKIDIREIIKGKITNGEIQIHESRKNMTPRELATMICHAQEKHQFKDKGIFGDWDIRAQRDLLTALMRPKRNFKSSSSTTSVLPATSARMLIEDFLYSTLY